MYHLIRGMLMWGGTQNFAGTTTCTVSSKAFFLFLPSWGRLLLSSRGNPMVVVRIGSGGKKGNSKVEKRLRNTVGTRRNLNTNSCKTKGYYYLGSFSKILNEDFIFLKS